MSALPSTTLSVEHLVSILDLSMDDIDLLLRRAQNQSSEMTLQGRQIALLFYENSTRTFNSFKTAIHQLGGITCGFSGVGGTSVLKGESLHDTVKMFEEYADAIVLRHPNDGAPRWASEISSVPVINAGDGQNQHPTQTLLDLLAIKDTQGRLSGLKVAMVGDLKHGRTVRSLSHALAMYPNNELYFVSPPSLRFPRHVVETLREQEVEVMETERLEDVIKEVDILYVTRIQKERMESPGEYEEVKGSYQITTSNLLHVKPHMKILHPLPRVDEIATEVDRTQHAYYFQQARGGIQIRKALLELLLGVPRK